MIDLIVNGNEKARYALKLLEYAYVDIKSAKILYKKKIFSTSIFHLQQAVEKAVKSWSIVYGIVSKDELVSKIGHLSLEAYISLLDKSVSYLEMFMDKKKINDLIKSKNKIKEILKRGMSEELLFANDDQIRAILKYIDDVYEGYLPILKRTVSVLDHILKKRILKLFVVDFTKSFLNLYVLSALTLGHEKFTRYPYDEFPIEKYNSDLGIVKTLDDLIDRCEKSIKCLRKVFSFFLEPEKIIKKSKDKKVSSNVS